MVGRLVISRTAATPSEMRKTRSAIVAFCLVGVFPGAASAQVADLPPASVPAVAATADVSADAAGVAVRVEASVDTAGGASGSPSVSGTAKTGAAGVDVSAGAGTGSGGPQAALDVAVSIEETSQAPRTTPSQAPRTAPAPGTREQASGRSEAPSARTREVTAPRSKRAAAPAERLDSGNESVARRLRDGSPLVSMSLRTRTENDRRADRSGGDAVPGSGGSSPDEAVPPAGGVSSAAALFSLAAVLIPLVGWAFGHAGAASPRRLFISFLERPG